MPRRGGWLLAASLLSFLPACTPASQPQTPVASGSGGLVIITAGGTALVDGEADVPPTLDMRVSASQPLQPTSVQAKLDGTTLPLHSAGAAVTANVAPMRLGSSHVLDLEVPGRAAEQLHFSVVPPAGAMAALHSDARDGAVLDVAFQFAPDHPGVEAALPHGAIATWADDRHLRASWPAAPGGTFTLPAGMPVARGSHLAAALTLPLDPVASGTVRRTVEPAPAALTTAPLVVAFTVGTQRSRASLAAHWSQISLASPSGVRISSDGTLRGVPDDAAVATAAAHGLPVWPLLQNDATDSAGISALLGDAAAVRRFVDSARRAAAAGGFAGLHLDIEGVPEPDRDHLTALITQLGAALHADGRRLAVAVVPHKPGHLNVYSAAYDLRPISAAADLVTLMAYDEHTSRTEPGAVAGLAWDRQILDGTLPEMRTPTTALLGLPLYARTWSGNAATADSYAASLAAALTAPGARVDYDFGAATPYVHSGDSSSLTYFDDAQSLQAKLALAGARQLRGIALWRLGFEDPAWWAALPQNPPRP